MCVENNTLFRYFNSVTQNCHFGYLDTDLHCMHCMYFDNNHVKFLKIELCHNNWLQLAYNKIFRKYKPNIFVKKIYMYYTYYVVNIIYTWSSTMINFCEQNKNYKGFLYYHSIASLSRLILDENFVPGWSFLLPYGKITTAWVLSFGLYN